MTEKEMTTESEKLIPCVICGFEEGHYVCSRSPLIKLLDEKEKQIEDLTDEGHQLINQLGQRQKELEKMLDEKEQGIEELVEALIWAKNVIREWDTEMKDEKEDLGFILRILSKHSAKNSLEVK